MLIGLGIRDVVLIEALDLAIGPGLTALTGETGAGKSIVLDALGLATGARADAGLVRRGAGQASASAVFSLSIGHPVFALLADKGLDADPAEDLVLRRQVSADGRSRAFVNDQAASVGVLRELGALLVEVHGQHDAVGLLDARTHRGLLDSYGDCAAPARACRQGWTVWRDARGVAEALRARVTKDAAEAEELTLRLAELDRLDAREGEEAVLADRRTLLGASEKVMADISAAKDALTAGQVIARLSQAARALERARERVQTSSAVKDVEVETDNSAAARLAEAAAAVERTLIEADEASTAVDAAAQAFVFDPAELEKTEERLFALRAAARKLAVAVEALPTMRVRFADALRSLESADAELAHAQASADAAETAYVEAAARLSAARHAAAERLTAAVQAELKPLKLEKAQFSVQVASLGEDRAGPEGADRVTFEISTNAGAPFGPLGDIASGGELARFALALKAALAARGEGGPGNVSGRGRFGPAMIFDEVDQGVGGAVADAVGLRLKRLAETGQVLVVTHSPQVAARADVHWRVSKSAHAERAATAIETLGPGSREEEIARMLAGAQVTEAARAAARALMDV